MSKPLKVVCVAVCALVLLLLMLRTWQQQGVWLNDEALWRHGVKLNPDSPYVRMNLALELYDLGKYRQAEEHFRYVIREHPQARTASNPHVWLCATLSALQEHEQAAVVCSTAARLAPKDVETHRDLGAALYNLGRSRDALQAFDRALALAPGDSAVVQNRRIVVRRIVQEELQGKRLPVEKKGQAESVHETHYKQSQEIFQKAAP